MSTSNILTPNSLDLHSKQLNVSGLIAVATPNDVNAAAAGVPVWGLYRDSASGAVYVRTA